MRIDTIFVEYDPRLLPYSLWTFGFHFGIFVDHFFFEERKSDFAEMFLHHIAAVCLYFAYIFGGLVTFGSIAAYLHDVADVPANLARSLSATRLEPLTFVCALIMMAAWFYTRCYLLPQLIYFLVTEVSYPDHLK